MYLQGTNASDKEYITRLEQENKDGQRQVTRNKTTTKTIK